MLTCSLYRDLHT